MAFLPLNCGDLRAAVLPLWPVLRQWGGWQPVLPCRRRHSLPVSRPTLKDLHAAREAAQRDVLHLWDRRREPSLWLTALPAVAQAEGTSVFTVCI
jgi:hypothetical protein